MQQKLNEPVLNCRKKGQFLDFLLS